MKKMLLLLVAIAGIAYFEPARTRIMKLVGFAGDATRGKSAEQALRGILVDVQRAEARTGSYPRPEAFAQWLRESERSRADPWGSEYYLEIFNDSLVVGSPGPDRRKSSADDLRLARRREPTAAALGTALSPPAPPSSGVKRSALRKLDEQVKRDRP